MPRTEDPYSRVYWRAIDDPKFEHVWHDDHALAWWLRLLITADQAWPASASMPAGIHRGGLRKLVDAGLVEVNGMRYRIHGLDAERDRRSHQGKAGAGARWGDRGMPTDTRSDSERNANALPTHSFGNASQDETRQDETRRDEHSARAPRIIDGFYDGLPSLDDETLDAAMSLTRQSPGRAGEKQLTELDRLVAAHGGEGVRAALQKAARGAPNNPPTWVQLIYGARNVLEPIPGGQALTPGPMTLDDARDELLRRAGVR